MTRQGAHPLSFVFDVDGTVCFDGRTIEEPIACALRVAAHHRPIVFASARALRDLVPVLPDGLRHGTLIGGNGAFARPAGGDLSVRAFSPEVRAQLDGFIERTGTTYLIDGDWDYSFNGDRARRIFRQLDPGGQARNVDRASLASYVKAVLFTTETAHVEELAGLEVTLHRHLDEGHVDLSPRGIDKGAAIRSVVPGAYVAFGNDTNDLTMFTGADYAVCVGAHPVGECADLVVDQEQVAATILALDERHRP